MDEPRLLYRESDYLIIEKPAGLLVHPGPHPTDEPTLIDWLRQWAPGIDQVGDAPEIRPGIVHRLDKATSGLMVVATTQASFHGLKQLFQARVITKEYRALVHGVVHPPEGRIDRPIGIKPRTTKRSVFSSHMRKEAATRYAVLIQKATLASVAVFPETGRTHQIRVHFSSLGHPVLGDTLYAPKRVVPGVTRLMLHGHRLTFTYRGVSCDYLSEVPAIFETALDTSASS
jgi:23S rRNA pseudouridine1911/1915/1917 synthase